MDFNTIYAYLVDFIISKIDLADLLGLIGGIFYIASVTLRTMIPLRIAAIINNILFMGYGLLAKALPTFFMYAVLLPINCARLYQIQQLVKRVKVASQGDLDMEWLKPFMTKRNFKAGDVLFRKGDVANAMYYTVTGKFLVKEFNVVLPPGRVMGELAFWRRTTSAPQPSNASKTDRCCSSSMTRCGNCISRTRTLDSIS